MRARKLIMGAAALTMTMLLFSGCFSAPGQSQSDTSAPHSVVTASEKPQSVSQEQGISSISEESQSVPPAAAVTQEVAIGDTIITGNFEITLNYAMFANKVDARDAGSFISYVWQSADEGKILLDVSVHIKNLQQTTFTGTDVLAVTADYNNGYIYNHTIEAIEQAGMLESTSSFLGTLVTIDPLETIEVRYVLDFPEEVAENADAPLFLTIVIEGVKYRLNIR